MASLRAPSRKPVILRRINPNAALRIAYQKKLDALVGEMHASLVYWLTAQYRKAPPETANDESPAMLFRLAMERLSRHWLKRFDDAAPMLAKYFATKAQDRTDAMLKAALKAGGFAIEFHMTREANDVMQATIGEQVGLIRSIASQHLSEVEGLVMRSVQKGGDIGGLRKELEQRYGITRRRAALIARDQNSKATASMLRVRQQSLGITQAIWRHSHAGKEPRPSHVAADGKVYDVAKGMFLDGVWTWPGREINCRCVAQSVVKGWND